MEITKRQYIEAQKRHARIHDLLSEKGNIKHTCINYGLGEMWIEVDEKEHTIAYFEDYKELKQSQDHLINLLSVIDEVVEESHTHLYGNK